MGRHTLLYAFIIFLSTLIFNPALKAQTNDTLKIGTMKLPPYGWVDEKGNAHGIVYEMAEEIGKRSGLPFEHEIYPFNRMLKLLELGKIDLISSQPHERAMAAGEKLAVQFNIDVIAATKQGSGIEEISDFKGKSMIYHHGASYSQLHDLPDEITYVKSYKDSVLRLHKRNKWSGAVFSEPAYYYFMKQANLSPSDFGNVIYIERNKQQWIFVRKDLPEEIKAKLKPIVEDIFAEGMYEEMLTKYGKSD